MARLDFTPLFRSTVGFDHLSHLLNHAFQMDDSAVAYPPYNIEKRGEDEYRIVMAVAGFAADDIEIVTAQNRLTVSGRVKEEDERTYLHRGIAGRAFERRFDLADFIEVTGATLENGLLTINLKRELPESMKPRNIEIGASKAARIVHKGAKDPKDTKDAGQAV